MMKCGLLGRKLSHSYSPQIHAMLGEYEYLLYEKEPEELDEFLASGSPDALNVTIPYKKAVLPFCSKLSDTAQAIGSVNTMKKLPDGTWYGDNTDAFGFENLLLSNKMDVAGHKVLVLGSGGASVTVCAVLKKLGAREVVVISRSGDNNYTNLSRHADAQFLVNATPVGMYPCNGEKAVDLSCFPLLKGVADVVYNPARTALLLQAEELGIPCVSGLRMLVAQAKRSSEIFTGTAIADSEITRITASLQNEMMNIVLIGMPGAGKSRCAEALGAILNRPVVETDAAIEKAAGKTIPAIFAADGEDAFRALESSALAEAGKRSGIIISTGGGCITRAENYNLLHQNGHIFWLQRNISLLAKDGRPISLRSDLNELYAARRPLYERFADTVIDNNGSIENTVSRILEVLQ